VTENMAADIENTLGEAPVDADEGASEDTSLFTDEGASEDTSLFTDEGASDEMAAEVYDAESTSDRTADRAAESASGLTADSTAEEVHEEPDMEYLTGAMEAILFAMGEPVRFDTLAKALEVDEERIPEIAACLRETYRPKSRGIELSILEDTLQLNTKGDYYRNLITIASIHEKPVLTGPMLETLSIVAYRQPVTRAEITRIRGVSSDHAVSRLVDFGLIEEAGRLEAPGRPILFVTSKEFLRRFGMESLAQLPEQEMPGTLADRKAGTGAEPGMAETAEQEPQETAGQDSTGPKPQEAAEQDIAGQDSTEPESQEAAEQDSAE